MRIRSAARTDIGRARERNEDSYLARNPLFAVADGMGGHRGGNVASALAVETLSRFPLPERAAIAVLVEGVKRANEQVLERGTADSDLRGMGTTVTALLADRDRAYLAHVGDSRAYLFRDGELQQLTEDHTLVQRMVREGRITAEEAGRHPQRSVVTRALGVGEDVPVDELTLDLHPSDRILLCTDGLTSMVDREAILAILESEAELQAACDRLVDAANEAGGDDNITVVLLEVSEEDLHSARSPADAGATTTALAEGTPVAPPPRRRRRWRRVALWAGVSAALIVGALVGTRLYVDRQWFVGESAGRVAIFKGIPSRVAGFRLYRLEEVTELDAATAERLQPWRGLPDGITTNSLADAEAIVAQIRQDLSAPAGGSG